MFFTRLVCALLVSASVAAARQAEEGLTYAVWIQQQGRVEPIRAKLRVVPLPALKTRNKVKKPRLGRWKLAVADAPKDIPVPMLAAKLERLLYLAGPAPGMSPEGTREGIDGRLCRLWSFMTPPGLDVSVSLAEVSDGLLAVSRLEGALPQLGFDHVFIKLTRSRLRKNVAPAESGTSLMATLQRAASMSGKKVDGNLQEERVD